MMIMDDNHNQNDNHNDNNVFIVKRRFTKSNDLPNGDSHYNQVKPFASLYN